MWILKNSTNLLSSLGSLGVHKATSIQTFDFSTLYTSIPHDLLKSRMNNIINNAFKHKKGATRYTHIKVGRNKSYFTSDPLNGDNKYTANDGIRTITPRTITPRTITPGQIPPGQLPPRTNTPRTFTPPEKFFKHLPWYSLYLYSSYSFLLGRTKYPFYVSYHKIDTRTLSAKSAVVKRHNGVRQIKQRCIQAHPRKSRLRQTKGAEEWRSLLGM